MISCCFSNAVSLSSILGISPVLSFSRYFRIWADESSKPRITRLISSFSWSNFSTELNICLIFLAIWAGKSNSRSILRIISIRPLVSGLLLRRLSTQASGMGLRCPWIEGSRSPIQLCLRLGCHQLSKPLHQPHTLSLGDMLLKRLDPPRLSRSYYSRGSVGSSRRSHWNPDNIGS